LIIISHNLVSNYIFTSERLGFRNWQEADIEPMSALNADPDVMEFFPSIKSKKETAQFVLRMQNQQKEKGFCYYAVDRLDTQEFIGFIGFGWQTFEASFNPSVDIGWRLSKSNWGMGFATEGAVQCLKYGFEKLAFNKVNSIASVGNKKSTNVMQKIGMQEVMNFEHPLLIDFPLIKYCVLFSIEKQSFL